MVRVMFSDLDWEHTFWHDGEDFDLYRAERLPWILEAIQRPNEIRVDWIPGREDYILTEDKWGENFVVIVRGTKRPDRWIFQTAFPLDLQTLLKKRCHPEVRI